MKTLNSLTITGLVLIAGCSQPVENVRPQPLSFEQATGGSLSKKPTAPFDKVSIESQVKQISESKEPSLAERLLEHPNTLYWKENNTWGFYQGEALAAEVDTQKRMVVRDASDEGGVKMCVFDAQGKLARASNSDAGQCEQLMFSLDQALDE